MNAIVPDTLQGALIISVIDFFLSFVIISGIGVVLALFPLLNRGAKFRWRSRRRAVIVAKTATSQAGHAAPSDVGIDGQDDIAAIAAAVLVVMDGAPHRILHIEPSHHGAGWLAEGRQSHHGSHRPRA